MAYALIVFVFAFAALAVGFSPFLAFVIAIPLFVLFLVWVAVNGRIERRRETRSGRKGPFKEPYSDPHTHPESGDRAGQETREADTSAEGASSTIPKENRHH